ncbi:phosphonate ABC transporter, permease protein PhnE [Metabacillus fastidiosus]|uniref:phosphonate ABC transporter, permease protein PhnE n=1 Tax=Metabacillus fastidiosus TaxID=1458 RepID=UPI003D276AF1
MRKALQTKNPSFNTKWPQIIGITILLAFILIWTANDLELSVSTFIGGIPSLLHLIGKMLPPDFSVFGGLIRPMIVTLEVALWGTLIAIVVSTVLAMGAAKNLFGSIRIVYYVSRFILNTLRSIPDLIWALIFVAAVGLGSFPGVLALAVYSCGELGKLYAEAIENIDPGPRESLESTGVKLLTVFRWSIVPQIFPEMITYTLYRLESNVRHATVLGLVGAGGLGFELNTAMRLFRYNEAFMIILVIILMVTITDFISGKLRQKII